MRSCPIQFNKETTTINLNSYKLLKAKAHRNKPSRRLRRKIEKTMKTNLTLREEGPEMGHMLS